MLPNNSHIQIGGFSFLLDESYESLTGRRCYIHGGRSIFAGRTDITGRPGAQNLDPQYLVWDLTRYNGEGQVVLDPADNDSQFLFYRSEGLNFRVPGQFGLNKSILSETVKTTSSATTWEGAADFADVSGTSTTSGTDRILTLANKVAATSSVTPGANNVQMDFYLYSQAFADTATTIQGSAFNKVDGSPKVSGSDTILTRGDKVWSAKLSSGSELTADAISRVELYMSVTSIRGQFIRFQIIDVTHADNVVAGGLFDLSTTSGTPFAATTFTPKAGHDYRVLVAVPSSIEPTPVQSTLDKILYGKDTAANNTATIEVYNQTGSATVATKTVAVTATAAGTNVGSISFLGVAATAYRARVTRAAGTNKIVVDKVISRTLSGASWVIDCLDFGLGAQTAGVFTPKIWAVAHDAGASADNLEFVYDTATDTWIDGSDGSGLNSATGNNLTCYAMAHSDANEFALLSSNEVIRWTAAGVDTLTYTDIPAGVGMTVAQDRLFVLSEGSSGTTVYCSPLTAAGVNITTDVDTRFVVINSGTKTPDSSLRQRMCASPTGARFFINYGDVAAKIYEVDSSGAALQPRELADLGAGVKATCIAFQGGITYIGAQYYGNSSTSDVDQKPRALLYAIDQNGVLQQVEFFRKDSPDVRPPQFIVPYQTDVYVLQGTYVWRHDLTDGGLYLEYQIEPTTPGEQRALAVSYGGRIFAAFKTEIFVAGSVGTYRQSSVSGGSTYTSSISDFGLPSMKKALAKIDLSTNTMAANTRVNLEYQVDQNGTWVAAGQSTAGTRQTFYIQDTSFTTLQVRVKCDTTDGVSTPVVKGVTVWAEAAEDEEYFDLVVLSEDQDSSWRIADEQAPGTEKSNELIGLWRNKTVTSFQDGYLADGPGDNYLVTITDIRNEQITEQEGRTVLTLRVVR